MSNTIPLFKWYLKAIQAVFSKFFSFHKKQWGRKLLFKWGYWYYVGTWDIFLVCVNLCTINLVYQSFPWAVYIAVFAAFLVGGRKTKHGKETYQPCSLFMCCQTFSNRFCGFNCELFSNKIGKMTWFYFISTGF